MKISGQERLNSTSRLQFHCDVTALGLLCSPAATTCLESAVESFNFRDRRNFLRGYRLAVTTPLHSMLSFVVDHAELLGLENDDRLANWLHFRNPARGESLLDAVSDPTSDLSRLCYVFNDLQVALPRAEGDLTDTVAVIEKCRAGAGVFDKVLSGTEVVSLDVGQEFLDGKSLLSLCVAERVLDYAEYDPGVVRGAHSSVWGDEDGSPPVDDDSTLRAKTHLSHVPLFPFGRGVPREWGKGLWFGFDLMLRLNGVALPTHVASDSDPLVDNEWVDELAAFVNPSRPEGKWPRQVYGLTKFSDSTMRRMIGGLEVNTGIVSSKRRLAALLGSDRVRLMSDAGATDALELQVMLSGAIATCKDPKVRLLLLSHSVASDSREWVSIALRLPMYGIVSNASKWFLFYKMYHKGHAFDTDVARAIKAVEELLMRFKDNLEVEEIDGLDSEDFLPLCVLPAFRAMRELSQRAVDTNSDLRSGNSELLAAHWLVGQGYHHVKVSFKHALIGNFEYDAIGVKDEQCLILEVKSASLVDRELQKEIEKLASKIKHLRDRLPELRKALGSKSDIDGVSGLFIFLGGLGRFKSTEPSIPLWGYDDFAKALKAMGLRDRIVGLLDRKHIVHSMQTNAFPKDAFFAGLEESSVEV